jgi:hypothetical protein
MKEFKYAPTKMIKAYNDSTKSGSKISKSEDIDIISLSLPKYNPLNGKKDGSVKFEMSIASLKSVRDRFKSDLGLIDSFLEEISLL